MGRQEPADRCEAKPEPDETSGSEHLDDLPDGAGCTGIWEYLSERRQSDDD